MANKKRVPAQAQIFRQNEIGKLVIQQFLVAPETESRTSDQNIKLCQSQKEAAEKLARLQGIPTGKLLYDAIQFYMRNYTYHDPSLVEFYRAVFPYRDKIMRHRELLLNTIKNLT